VIDIHNHILPGLDDGASDWEQSIAMARIAVKDGITEIVCTPHWVPGKYDNTRKIILDRFSEFKTRLSEHGIPLTVYPGAELRLDATLPERLRTSELLTINDGGVYILIELPEETLPDNLEDFLWQLQLLNFTPVISHVERNAALRKDPMRLFRWVEMGILTQVTAASLLAEFSEDIRDHAFRLLSHRMVHMIVTDSHGLRMRIPQLSAACAVLKDIVGPEISREMIYDIPKRIIEGKPVTAADPLPFHKESSRLSFWKQLFSGGTKVQS
jgi:protein-tyrosine phosphatase